MLNELGTAVSIEFIKATGTTLINKIWAAKNRKNSSEDPVKALNAHLESSFEKCHRLKTVLRDKREYFSKIYATQAFEHDGMRIDHVKLSQIIHQGESIVLQGTGGGGKSMFVRYLWLDYFSRRTDKGPLFIELRSVNSSPDTNLIDHLYYQAVGSQARHLSKAAFEEMLLNGDFLLILDGFDEISLRHAKIFQEQILRLKENYPKSTILVTSREHERFRGWHKFSSTKVLPLNQEECIEVLKRAPFDEEAVKERLIERVKRGLYISHNSFLSNPLLIYMTLLTFHHNPDFSDRMNEFYSQAFDALFYRHDQTKEGIYKREYRTGYNKTQFEKILSLFCLASYFDQKIDFSESEILDYVERAKSLDRDEFGSMKADAFLSDARHNVCVIREDGLQIVFTHRKLQEYFAAFCIARVRNKNMKRVLEHISDRTADEVISMCYELNCEAFREKYLNTYKKEYSGFFRLKRTSSISNRFSELGEFKFVTFIDDFFGRSGRLKRNIESVPIMVRGNSKFRNFFNSIIPIVKANEKDIYFNPAKQNDEADTAIFYEVMSFYYNRGQRPSDMCIIYGPSAPKIEVVVNDELELYESKNIEKLWKKSLIKAYIEGNSQMLFKFVNNETRKLENNSIALEDLL